MTSAVVAMTDKPPAVEFAENAIDINPRCRFCGKLLARFLTRPYLIDCRGCKSPNSSADIENKPLTDCGEQ